MRASVSGRGVQGTFRHARSPGGACGTGETYGGWARSSYGVSFLRSTGQRFFGARPRLPALAQICTIDGCNARRHTYKTRPPASMCSEHNAMFKVLQHELANHTGRTAGATALLRAYEASADGLGVLKNSLNRRYGTSDDAADLHKSMEAARARAIHLGVVLTEAPAPG